MARLWKTVLDLLHRGQVFKAANRKDSHGIANHANSEVKEQLQAKFRSSKKLLPRSVMKVNPVDSIKDL